MTTKPNRDSKLLCSKCGKKRKLKDSLCRSCNIPIGGMLLKVNMNNGRNKACPCGSGKKSKRCCNIAPRVDLVMRSSTGRTILIPQDEPWQVKLAHEMPEPITDQISDGHVEIIDLEKERATAAINEINIEDAREAALLDLI